MLVIYGQNTILEMTEQEALVLISQLANQLSAVKRMPASGALMSAVLEHPKPTKGSTHSPHAVSFVVRADKK